MLTYDGLFIVAGFIIVQVIFFLIDGTALEANIYDSRNIAGRNLNFMLFIKWWLLPSVIVTY